MGGAIPASSNIHPCILYWRGFRALPFTPLSAPEFGQMKFQKIIEAFELSAARELLLVAPSGRPSFWARKGGTGSVPAPDRLP